MIRGPWGVLTRGCDEGPAGPDQRCETCCVTWRGPLEQGCWNCGQPGELIGFGTKASP